MPVGRGKQVSKEGAYLAMWLTSDTKFNEVILSIFLKRDDMQFWLYNIQSDKIFRFRYEQNKASKWVRRERTKATWPTSDIKLSEVMRSISIEKDNMVITEKRIHLFPYRTQKLSSSSLMVLRPKGLGRVGHSQLLIRSSSKVEHPAVNR